MNEAPGKAAVHCVIIGFGVDNPEKKRLFEYAHIKGEPHEVVVKNINPYLVNADDVLIGNRQRPICKIPEIGIGNKPIDDGNYLFPPEGRVEFLKKEPQAKKYFRRWSGQSTPSTRSHGGRCVYSGRRETHLVERRRTGGVSIQPL